MKIIFPYLIVLISAISCIEQPKQLEQFKVELDDQFIQDAIRKYVHENNIDLEKKVITIKAQIGLKKVFTITDEPAALYRTNFIPTYYGILDDQIVFFVFTQVESKFRTKKSTVVEEIDEFLTRHGTVLSANGNLTDSAPVWRVIEECDNSYRLTKNVSPFEFETLPCGYTIVRDSVKLDSVMLIKR
jgi:hypothetical protein